MKSDRVNSRRPWVSTITIFVALLVAIVLAGLPLYVFPAVDDVGEADAAYVLGPPTNERLIVARNLLDQDRVDRLLVTVGKPGWGWSWPSVPECVDRSATCIVPHPFNTFGEAATRRLWTEQHKAERVIVITFTPHVVRARLIFAK